ncbi:MAG TPA: hypothetical protein VF173_09320 [Thermoanaerobaculia bacterium]|nr:hypothetical protein [Thermoanaerobaculia bacterium]
MELEARDPKMENIDDELFQAPLTDEALEGVSGGMELEPVDGGGGGVITYCDHPERTGIGQSEAFDSIRDT